MPANMMKAGVGSSEYVAGNSKATVSAGPMPGRTPTAVPSVTPARAQARFVRVSALAKPAPSAAKTSIRRRGSRPRGENARGQRQAQRARENQIGGHGQHGS